MGCTADSRFYFKPALRQDDQACQQWMIVGDIGIFKLHPVFEFNCEPAAKVPGINTQAFWIQFGEDHLGFF